MSALLQIENLEVSYGEARALNGISFSLESGSLFAIVGSNGAGKTSLVRSIGGMLKPTGGRIVFDGIETTNLDSSATCEFGIGQVAEGRQIFPSLTVEENLLLGAALKRASAKRKENFERVYTMFPKLNERRNQKAGTLSGGEQQMLAIGRCLMSEPRLIMFDEPSLGLSPVMVEFVFDAIVTLKKSGMSILLIEQNVAESLEIADSAAVLENGTIALSGAAEALAMDPRVRNAYLGI
jgi:branched-chain amino acid transport system ATP-binding protein